MRSNTRIKLRESLEVLSNSEIIDKYYNSIVASAKAVYNSTLSMDIANDISIRFLEYDNEKLNRLHDNKEFEKYVYRVIVNEKINNTSKSSKKYGGYCSLHDDIEYEVVDEVINIKDFINILTPYEIKLLSIVSEFNNIQKISNKYKIRRATIHEDMNNIREKIKKHLKNKI